MTHTRTEASPDLLGRQLQAHILTLPNVLAAAQSLADDLQSLLVTTYTVDHAEEHLLHLADALDHYSHLIRGLAEHTRTGVARANARTEMRPADTRVWVYGTSEAVVLLPDEEGAIVREVDDGSETWFPWTDLTVRAEQEA